MIVAQVVPSIPDVISAQADGHRHLAWRGIASWYPRCLLVLACTIMAARRRHNEIDGKKVR
jgi:hypothetical protein